MNSLIHEFGRYAYDYTLHAHLHLACQVRLHGPLQSNSQFVFEEAIYNFKLLLHGTRGYLDQIVRDVEATKNFAHNINSTKFSDENIYKFCFSNYTRYAIPKIEVLRLLDPISSRLFTEEEINLIEYSACPIETSMVHVFSEKILYNKQVYHSLFYLRKG